MSSIGLLIIHDGREDYRQRTLASAREHLEPADQDIFQARIVVNDEHHRLGFAGAIQRGWDIVLDTGCRWVFHLEADFVFNGPVPVREMVAALDELQPDKVAQIALKRQPWNDAEKAAGGIVELSPDDYDERLAAGHPVSLHSKVFTTNPSVYSAELCERGWPQEPRSEGVFTHQLLAEGYRFGFWGGRFDPPAVEHIGELRTGCGY